MNVLDTVGELTFNPSAGSSRAPERITPIGDKLLFIPEVAERLRRSTDQIRWMVQKGTAPKSAIIAGRRVFRESDVEAFIEAAFEKESEVTP